MRTARSNGDRIDRAMRSFTSDRRGASRRRRLVGWLSALLLVSVLAPAVQLGRASESRPDAALLEPATDGRSIGDVGGEGVRIRLIDDTVPPTGSTGSTVSPTGSTGSTVPPTGSTGSTGSTAPPTTEASTTIPPTTGPATTAPPTSESPTTGSTTTESTTTTTITTVVPTPAPPAPVITVPSPRPPVEPRRVVPPDRIEEPTPGSETPKIAEDETEVDQPEPGASPPTTRPAAPAPRQRVEPPAPVTVPARGTGIGASEMSTFGSALPTFGNGDFSPLRVGTNTVLAAVLSLLIILPAELFNSTLRVNYELVLRPVQRLRDASTAVIDAVQARLPGSRIAGTALFALVAALASSALDPRFGLGWGSLRLLVAQTLALFVSTFAVCRISLLIGRRHGIGGEIALRPGGLVLCFAVVLLSRAIGVSPGFLYGLVVGLQFHSPMSIERVGRIALVQAGFLLSLGVSSWLLLGVFHETFAGPSPGLLPSLGAEVLTALSIGTTTGLVLSMMPLTYLRGERLFVWNRPVWILTYSLVFFAFLSIAVNPVFGSLPTTDSLRIWLGLYALFGVGSVLFWLRYRNTENRSALDRLTEALPRL